MPANAPLDLSTAPFPPVPGAAGLPGAPARGSAPAMPDFRAGAYPFANDRSPRWNTPAPRVQAGRRERLLYGVLCALVAVVVGMLIILALRYADHSMRGG